MPSSLFAHVWELKSEQIPIPQLHGDVGTVGPVFKQVLGGERVPSSGHHWERLWSGVAQPRTKQSFAWPSHWLS